MGRGQSGWKEGVEEIIGKTCRATIQPLVSFRVPATVTKRPASTATYCGSTMGDDLRGYADDLAANPQTEGAF